MYYYVQVCSGNSTKRSTPSSVRKRKEGRSERNRSEDQKEASTRRAVWNRSVLSRHVFVSAHQPFMFTRRNCVCQTSPAHPVRCCRWCVCCCRWCSLCSWLPVGVKPSPRRAAPPHPATCR